MTTARSCRRLSTPHSTPAGGAPSSASSLASAERLGSAAAFERRQRLLGAGEDEAVGGQPGHREDSLDLVARCVDGEAAALLLHPAMGAEDHRDPGGVDEGAAREADEDAVALGHRRRQDLVELAGDGEVELAFDLDISAARLPVVGGDVKALH